MPDRLIDARAGEKLCVLGNEAIARGALEAGVRFVSGYPGTPASEIGDTFQRIHDETGVLFEWSVNEKVALETAFGSAIMGARSLCHMKHLGLAYAGDPLGTIPYLGVEAGMVIVSAADPGMVVSPNEQDQRHLARMNRIPVIEPSTPAECLSLTKFAFELSETTGLPVILRTTPRVAHSRGDIQVGEINPANGEAVFRRRPMELTPVPANARRMLVKLDERLARCEKILAESDCFFRKGSGRLGVVASGAVIPLVLDQVEELGLSDRFSILCAGATHPLPVQLFSGFLKDVDRLLVIEELTPFIEDELLALAHRIRPELQVCGKRSGLLPSRFDYGIDLVADALAEFAGAGPRRIATLDAPDLPPRPPVLCPGCPHRNSYLAARTVFGDDGIYFNDIGCYTLGFGPPLETVDALLSMGSSIAMASAASRVLGRKTLAFIGDSTFFHSGMPGLLNAAEKGDDLVVMVLDNRITSMTGHQPSPGGAAIEEVARSLGIEKVVVVDPNDLRATTRALLDGKRTSGLSVVISRRECAIVRFREEAASPHRRKYAVDPERCRHCGHESDDLWCGQQAPKGYERSLVLRRILDQDGKLVRPEPPCSAACPSNICVHGYIGRIAGGNYAEALALIRKRNPLAVVSSRVCHRPCEKVCTRSDTDGPVAVNDLKRWLADWEMADPGRVAAVETGPDTGKRVAVIGAGPSGLSCAHELRRRGHRVVIMDQHHQPGGVLTLGIPEHRLPREVLGYETDWILGHGIEFRGNVRLGNDVTLTGLLSDGFDAVYLGFGAMAGVNLGVPGDDMPGNVLALDMLKRNHAGERLEVEGRSVIVVGGGDAAVDSARTLIRGGASEVRIVYRRERSDMPAHPEEIDAAVEEGVELLTSLAPVSVNGSGRVGGLRVVGTEPGEPDSSGRRRPVHVPGTEHDLKADMVVSAVGQRPDLSSIAGQLDVTAGRFIAVDPQTGATSMAGVFAGGDLTPGWMTVVNAVADGRRAAYGIDLYLAREGDSVRPAEFLDPASMAFLQPARIDPEPGHRTVLRPAEQRRLDNDDAVVPLTEEQARREAARCMLCAMCSSCSACTDLFGCPAFRQEDGRMVIDQALCSGCGVCATFCPNGAIYEVGE